MGKTERPSFFLRVGTMKSEKFNAALAAIVITVFISIPLFFLSTNIFEGYGLGLFIVAPLICGMISVLFYNRNGKKNFGESISVSVLAGCISLLCFFVVGFEGIICIIMSAPVVMPSFWIGGILGFAISRKIDGGKSSDSLILLLLAFVPLFMGIESFNLGKENERSVTTKVVISGSVEEIWKEVIEFSPISEPEEFLFRIGIAYPIHAEIKGKGVGATRYCNFSTGSFVEPITHWEENKRLAFDVVEQPLPMTEVSPYVGIHPPHLDWAVLSHKGEFVLNDLGDGRVELIGTTWYHTVMAPEAYWGWICDEMIHMIHRRVLNHIQSTVESDTQVRDKPSPVDSEQLSGKARRTVLDKLRGAIIVMTKGRSAESRRVAGVIRDAFRGVTLGNGVGLFQAHGLDDYAGRETLDALRAKDEKDDWSSIPLAALNGRSSLSFFDAEGMRFHLPAYLIADLEGTLEKDVLFHLTHLENDALSRFQSLNSAQRNAVLEYLLLQLPGNDFTRPMIEKAIAEYWTAEKK